MKKNPPAPNSSVHATELIEDLSGDDELAKLSAIYKLAEMRNEAAMAVPMLTENLQDKHSYDVQKQQLLLLAKLARKRNHLSRIILFMLTDFAHGGVAAAEALGKIGDKSAIPALVQALDHRYSELVSQQPNQ